MSKNEESNEVIKKKNSKLIIILLAVGISLFLILSVLGLAVGAIAAIATRKIVLNNRLDQGSKYLLDLDYDNAILYYEKAIKIDKKNTEALEGLSKAYEGKGDELFDDGQYEQAIENYIKSTDYNDQNVQAYLKEAEAYVQLGDYEAAIELLRGALMKTSDSLIQARLNELELIWNTLASIFGVITIADDDVNYANNQLLDNADISLKSLHGSYNGQTSTNSNGEYSFDNLRVGKYELTVSKEGYLPTSQTMEIYGYQTSVTNPIIELIPNEKSGLGTASGIIYDALTGMGVEDLSINIRHGYNEVSSEIVDTITTSYGGGYTTPELDAGIYTLEIKDNREGESEKYLDSLINVKIIGQRNIDEQNGTVSTQLLNGQLRIVLSWGETPNDLDSHLYGVFDDGGGIHTAYDHLDGYDYEGNIIAALDLDDTDCYGPETTTLYIPKDGEYTFVVHDYSGYSMDDIAMSGAVVQVYLSNSSIPNYVFYAPQEQGLYWTVFKYDSKTGVVTAVNEMNDYIDDASFGSGVDFNYDYYYYDDYYYDDYYYDENYYDY